MCHRDRFSRLLAQVRRWLRGPRQSAAADLTCEQMVGFIAEYLTGVLDAETTLAFAKHLDGCEDCVAFLKTYQRTMTTVQALRFDEIPAELEQRLRQFLETRTRRSGHDR